MGCCSVTQRHTGVDEVGPDEIELLELSAENTGVWSPSENRLQLLIRSSREEPPPPHGPSGLLLEDEEVRRAQKPTPSQSSPNGSVSRHFGSLLKQHTEVVLWGRSSNELHHRICSEQPIRGWEGQAAHLYGEIHHSSLMTLFNSYTQESSERFLVLFSFHLLILSLDHQREDFIYEGVLPVSGLSLRVVPPDSGVSHSQHSFEISGPMLDSKVFICSSGAELNRWTRLIEDRRCQSVTRPPSPSRCPLSYLVPCDEPWKREELKRFLLQAPIWNWEGSPIQHMGPPGYVSVVHVLNSRKQGLQERLMVLFPQDVLLLSVDRKRLNLHYEGRLARRSIRAVERSAPPGRLDFELMGELLEPLQVSCTCLEDYQSWIFQLQQPDREGHVGVSRPPPPLVPKLQRSRKEPVMAAGQSPLRA